MLSVTIVPEINNPEKNRPDSKSVGKRIREKTGSFFRKHRKKKIAALILICVVLFIVIRSLGGQDQGLLVNAGEVVESSFEQTVLANGKLEVRNQQEFYANNKTTVTAVMAEIGQTVSKGQVILKTDDRNLAIEVSKNKLTCDDLRSKIVSSESSLRLLQQDYDLVQREYDMNKILFGEGAVSQKELKESEKKFSEVKEKIVLERDANLPLLKSQLTQAELILEESRERLQKATVVSSYDGVLLSLPFKKGQEVEIGKLLAMIGDPSKLQIETGINEVDAAQMAVGNKVQITNNSLLAEPLNGSVTYISPIAEAVTTSQGEQTQVKIRVSVDSSKGITKLKPGFNVNLKVILHQKDKALLIPFEAIAQNAGKNVVYVIGPDGLVEEREVQTGLNNELFTEIISGVKAGEKVVLGPDQQIQNGVKVIANAAS